LNVYEQMTDPVALTIFIFTLLLPVFVGIITTKRTKNQSDFIVGGRSINKFTVALSAVSTGRSSWLVLGVSGMAYTMGVGAVWAVVGYITAELFQFIFIGRKLREQTEKYGSLTLLDYFEERFKDSKNLIRSVGAVIIIIFLTAYVSAQFNAGASSLSTSMNIPFLYAILISAALILIYMVLGGYIAVVYNDMIRAVIMILGLVIFPVMAILKFGGIKIVLETLKALDPSMIDPFSLSAGMIIGFLGIGLGSPGQPHIVVRYMSVKDPAKLRDSAVIGTIWNVVMAWGAVFIGLAGRAFVNSTADLPDKNPEMIYLVLASKLCGPVLYGLLVGGIFAAILSTADSQLLVVSSTFVRDIYGKILKKRRENIRMSDLTLNRIIVVAAGICAVVLGILAKDIIFWLVLFAWGGLGASIGPALIFSLFWEKTTAKGVVAGMLTGTTVTIIWKLFIKNIVNIYELIPAFLLASLAVWAVSKLTKK